MSGSAESESRRVWALGIAAIVIGTALRIHGLGDKSLWLDESISLVRISGSFSQMLDDVMKNDGHPPLYYSWLYIGTSPFKKSAGDRPEFPPNGITDAVLRFPSAIAGILTLLAVFAIELETTERNETPFGTVLAAISGFLIYFSQEARHYALAGLFTVTATAFLIRAVKRDKKVDWGLFVLLSALSLYTFYYSVFFLITHVAAVYWFRLRVSRNSKAATVPIASCVMPFVVFLFYLPTINRMRERVAQAGAPLGWKLPPMQSWMTLAAETSLGFNAVNSYSWLTLAAGAAIGIAPLCWLFASARNVGTRMLLLIFVGPAVCLLLFPLKPHLFQSKHLFAMAPLFCLLAGGAIRSLLNERRTALWGLIYACVVIVINLHSIYFLKTDYVKEDWVRAADFLGDTPETSAVIVPAPDYLRVPLMVYYNRHDALYSARELAPSKNVWLVELLDSPVSFDDVKTKSQVAQGRQPTQEKLFPGELGVIRLTYWSAATDKAKSSAPQTQP